MWKMGISEQGFQRLAQEQQSTTEKKPLFYGEIEFLKGQKAAIITLYDEQGEWSGSGRISQTNGTLESLYEEGYSKASQTAASKGGRLERFTVIVGRRWTVETPL